MARYTDEKAISAITPHLQAGERLLNHAYGVKQPHIGLIIGLLCLAILPGVIAIALLTKEYLVALTDRRFIVLRVKGGKAAVQEVLEYDRASMPPVEAKTGGLFTHIRITDAAKPFIAKFHRMGMKENRANSQAIGAALTGGPA
ncbi:MAG: hypothetical protein ACFCVH_14295 [Alphaproteobacteria bacterium]